ncbi:hypothetical protein NQ317_000285 [Molorchus minor]|uniref:Uncharacterized protein n=1 Tax=Molorchus minor TaxID=1323400 RepID=A0ABQ9JBG9_9CUCU|nr:hypothetical protein NQ317_000285 [Molorchus minor]
MHEEFPPVQHWGECPLAKNRIQRLVPATFIDEDILKQAGITDLKHYASVPENADKLMPDFSLMMMYHHHHLVFPPLDARQTKTGEEPKGEVAKLFKAIGSGLSQDTVAKTQAVFEFNVTGT